MNSSSEKKISPDPFAADIFAEYKESSSTAEKISDDEKEKAGMWNKVLPRAAKSQTDWTALKNGLPSSFFTDLPRRLADSLKKLLNLPDEKTIEFLFLVQREINAVENSNAENSWWLRAGIENSQSEIVFELDNAFATWLIDATLGEKVSNNAEVFRDLTASEEVVLEFLGLNVAHEANLVLQSPIFKFRSLSRDIPASIEQNLRGEDSSMLIASWQIVHQMLPSIVSIYLTPDALRSLSATENKLLDSPQYRRLNLQNLQNRLTNLRMRLVIGNTKLSVAELAALELKDVVLLENTNLFYENGFLDGRTEIFLGDGENVKIVGNLTPDNYATNESIEEKDLNDDNKILVSKFKSNRPLRMAIESFTENQFPATGEKSMAETDENFGGEMSQETNSEQINLAVENLAVTLRVELEARKLLISEIGNLSENQILELGIRPTDQVNLLINDKIIGRGELVIVEERLGVRITKLLR